MFGANFLGPWIFDCDKHYHQNLTVLRPEGTVVTFGSSLSAGFWGITFPHVCRFRRYVGVVQICFKMGSENEVREKLRKGSLTQHGQGIPVPLH